MDIAIIKCTKEGMQMTKIVDILEIVLYIYILLIVSSVLPIIVVKDHRKDMNIFKNLFFENFHLNNAATFIGYTVFEQRRIWLCFYFFSFIIYLIEHFVVGEDSKMGKGIQIFQIAVFLIGVAGQFIYVCCCCI